MHVTQSEMRAGTACRSIQKLSVDSRAMKADGMKCWMTKNVVRLRRMKFALRLSNEPAET